MYYSLPHTNINACTFVLPVLIHETSNNKRRLSLSMSKLAYMGYGCTDLQKISLGQEDLGLVHATDTICWRVTDNVHQHHGPVTPTIKHLVLCLTVCWHVTHHTPTLRPCHIGHQTLSVLLACVLTCHPPRTSAPRTCHIHHQTLSVLFAWLLTCHPPALSPCHINHQTLN